MVFVYLILLSVDMESFAKPHSEILHCKDMPVANDFKRDKYLQRSSDCGICIAIFLWNMGADGVLNWIRAQGVAFHFQMKDNPHLSVGVRIHAQINRARNGSSPHQIFCSFPILSILLNSKKMGLTKSMTSSYPQL